MNATYALDDFSPAAEQYRYEHGGRVLNTGKVVRKFYSRIDGSEQKRCLPVHTPRYGDWHAETENGICTECGAREADYAAEGAEKFEHILDLEQAVRGAQAAITFRPIGTPDHIATAQQQNLRHARKNLSDTIDAMTAGDMAAYGPYRKVNYVDKYLQQP